MNTIFIGGSRHISRLPSEIKDRLNKVIDNQHCVLVGDANGADKAVQKHFADASYDKVSCLLVKRDVSFLVHTKRGRMKKKQAPEVPVRFYRSATGREPVLEWLRSLDKEDRRAIGLDLMRVQFGWPIGMPSMRSLKDGLWEVRSNLPSQRSHG